MEDKQIREVVFLAQTLRDAVTLELTSAAEKGELKYIKVEQIPDIAKVVYEYFAEYNKNSGGGPLSADINYVITTALRAYYEVKTGQTTYAPKETTKAFKKNIEGVDIVLEDNSLEKISSHFSSVEFVQNPIYQFAYLGNGGAFAAGSVNEKGIPERMQYFDQSGKFLPEPIVTYYVNGRWQSEPPKNSREFK